MKLKKKRPDSKHPNFQIKEWLQTLPASDWDEMKMKWTNEVTGEFSTSADHSVLRKDSIT